MPPATYPTGSLYVDQPTFGILNPLAVRGAGVSLTGGGSAVDLAGPRTAWKGSARSGGSPRTGTLSRVDMEALANGNSVLSVAPPSGVLVNNPNPGQLSDERADQCHAVPARTTARSSPTTGEIAHGTNGDNSDPNAQSLATGTYTGGTNSGVPTDANYGQYLLNIADRSLLGGVERGD